ncbi:MAG: hypothetical protein PHU24_06775 [Sphaerochaetaceae bacterium]|jgi:hypothetical protein|nr:hypothetical protein [Sphaerochaetaceae bacterium]NLO61286.1 hypothetical protein [Spirochaetales bacterium]MDD2406141.1 hypothetical protein [Sphaerochaetaceae bacterium]MDD3671140.1 hypothetical protein [Sphaerochaetaceae bacterium]MDD4259066.1 hypothetical protein [Sphaerochaetaceae bacterium]
MSNGQERPVKQLKNRKNRKKKSKNPEQQALKNQKTRHPVKKTGEDEPQIIVPRIHEPTPTCALCGKPIDSIAQSIGGPEPETFNHFDCVLRKIADEEHVVPPQKVSYIGRGTFAVIEMKDDKTFSIVKRIPYESPDTFSFMKKYVESKKR